jgi:hypothetical protein
MSLSFQMFPLYFSPICGSNSNFVLTIKKTCCKWFPFSRRQDSHLTNTLFIARLSSTGQVEEATSQTASSRVFSVLQLHCSLYPSTLPIKKLTCVQIRWTGRSKSPADYSNATKKTQKTVGCASTKSVKFFLTKRMSSTRSVPVCNVTSSPKSSRVFANRFLVWNKFSLNLTHHSLLYGVRLMLYTKPQVAPIESPCRLQVNRKQLTASPPNDPGANQWVSCMLYKKASQRETTGHGCQITQYP